MTPLTRRMMLASFVAIPTLAACGQGKRDETAPKITLHSAWMRLPPGGRDISAAYVVIKNNGGADVLVSVSSPVADDVQMHISETIDGITRMRREQTVPVPARDSVIFQPGGRHLMVFGLPQNLKAGDEVPLAFIFQRLGTITVTAIVSNGP